MPSFWLWLIEWSFVGLLIGMLLFFVLGFIAKPLVDIKRLNAIANYYSKLAMKLIGRSVLMERGTKFDLFSTSHDGEKGADKFDLSGTEVHVSNETNLLSTIHKKPFGLIPPPEEDLSVYVSPELGELGEIESQRKEQGTIANDDGEYIPEVTLDPVRPLVQIKEFARRMIPESRQLYDLDETEELYKQSQRMFGESKTTQFMILLVAYGGAMLLTWLIMTNAGGAVPTGVEVPGI